MNPHLAFIGMLLPYTRTWGSGSDKRRDALTPDVWEAAKKKGALARVNALGRLTYGMAWP